MKRKASLLIFSSAALMLGAFAVFANAKHSGVVKTEAANYTRADKSFTLNEGAVSATFTVDGSDLNMEGWLLCLLNNKPVYDSNNKLDGANELHPYLYENCAHYFFAESNDDDGIVSVTWAANSADQKQAWSATETDGAEGKTLADYIAVKDWYIVIGPRHSANYGGSHPESDVGAGYNDHWENCDYYVGQKSSALIGAPIGETYLDLSEFTDWKDADAKFAFYYWDDNAHNGWSEFATDDDNDNIYTASYELDFVPTKMKVARLNKECPEPSWTYKYNESNEFDFYEYGVIGITGYDISKSWADALATLNGLGKTVVLDNYKRNGSGHSEHFNASVVLNENDEFVVGYYGTTFNTYSTNKKLNDSFELNEGKIRVKESGTYSLYFDTKEDVRSLYITTATLAEVDAWATTFLGANCTATKSGWESSSSEFDLLSDDAQNILLKEKHYTHDEAVSSLLERAVQRYDYVIELYGTTSYEDFIGRVNKHNLVPGSLNGSSTIVNQANNMGLLIAIIAATSSSFAFAVIMMIRSKNKKHQ